MKNSLLKRLTIVVIVFTALTACNSNNKEQITGTWQVVDAKFESKTPIDPALLKSSVEEMKTWKYTFNADSTMSVQQAERDIPNRWKLNKKGDSIIIGFGTGFFDVPSKIEKLTNDELVMLTILGADSAKITQTIFLKKDKK